LRRSDLHERPSLGGHAMSDLPAPLLLLHPSPLGGGADLGCRRCPRRLPVAELCPGWSNGRRRQLRASHQLARVVACGSDEPSLGWAVACLQLSVCAVVRWLAPPLQVGSLLVASSASLVAVVEARWATVHGSLASTMSDGRRVDGCRGDGPGSMFIVWDCLGYFRSPRSSVACSLCAFIVASLLELGFHCGSVFSLDGATIDLVFSLYCSSLMV
jgi:hypothetical protein